MFKYRKRVFAATAAVALAAGLAACGGSSDGSSNPGNSEPTSDAKGGDLLYYLYTPIEHLDPQRVYVGRDITNLSRTVYRTLVSFPISDDPDTANTPVADLATDTGTSTEGGKVWSFTVKDGVKWEDGQPVTCEDFKYGRRARSRPTSSPVARTTSSATWTSRPTSRRASRRTPAPTPTRARSTSTRLSRVTATPSRTTSTSRGRTSRWRSRVCT